MLLRSEESSPGCPARANPVYDGYFADPFVFQANGAYYAVGTGASPDREREFPVLRSTDFCHWELLGGALVPSVERAIRYWAPEVAQADGIFYMYYSTGVSDEKHELRVATSTTPEGPYLESPVPLLDPATAAFAIDPSPFRDDDGSWHLLYARDFLDSEERAKPGTALVIAPLITMTELSPAFTTVMRARHDWQRYQAHRRIYGGIYDWHTLEGPHIAKHDGLYYCFYSGGNWQNETYGVDYVVADSITGPWTDTNPGDAPRVLRSIPGKLVGPGHTSLTQDPDGHPCIAYHAWDSKRTARRFCLDLLTWSKEGPHAAGMEVG